MNSLCLITSSYECSTFNTYDKYGRNSANRYTVSQTQVPQDLQRDFNTKCSTLRINCIASVLASLYGLIFGEFLNNIKFKIH